MERVAADPPMVGDDLGCSHTHPPHFTDGERESIGFYHNPILTPTSSSSSNSFLVIDFRFSFPFFCSFDFPFLFIV